MRALYTLFFLLLFLLSLTGCDSDNVSSSEDFASDVEVSEEDGDISESDQDISEPDQDLSEPETEVTESDQDVSEPDQDLDGEVEETCSPACGPNQECLDEACICVEGFGDCDGDQGNGCEAILSDDPQNCGQCGTSCGTTQVCEEGSCVCGEGLGDCDGDLENGCEADLNTSEHCGTCETSCGDNQECTAEGCGCIGGFGDCDEDPSNGCEVELNSPEHCGTCEMGVGCDLHGIEQTCKVETEGARGYCPAECALGYLDLDGDLGQSVSNGCEIGLEPVGSYDLGHEITDIDDADGEIFLTYEDTVIKVARLSEDLSTLTHTFEGQYPSELTQPSVAISNGYLAVPVAGNSLEFFKLDTTDSVDTSLVGNLVGVEAVPGVSGSAEFLAYGGLGVKWLGIYASSLTGCTTLGTVYLCTRGSTGNPLAELIAVGALDGETGVFAYGKNSSGDASFADFQLSTGGFTFANCGGDTPDSPLAMTIHQEALYALEGDEFKRYDHTFDSSHRPEMRTEVPLFTAASPIDFTPVAEDYMALSDADGLHLLLGESEGIADDSLVGANHLLATDTHLYVAVGTTVYRYEIRQAP